MPFSLHGAIDLSTLALRHHTESHSLSTENFRRERGAAGAATLETSMNPGMALCTRRLATGWKVSPA